MVSNDKVYFFYGEIKSVDFVNDVVDGYIATGDLDSKRDILTENCRLDIADQFRNKDIKVDYAHEAVRGKDELDATLNATITPVASFDNNPIVDAKGVKLKSYLNKHSPQYDEIKGSIKDGHITAYSIAYYPRKWSYEYVDGERHRRLEKVDIFNVAYTGNPVNSEAKFTEIMLNSLDEVIEKTRGDFMAEGKTGPTKEELEIKAKEAAEKEAAETKAKLEAELKTSQEENNAAKAEVKALSEKFDIANKELLELKAKVETKDAGKPEVKDEMAKKVEGLEAKLEAQALEFKAFAEKVEVKGNAGNSTDAPGVESKDIKGPIDYCR